MSVISIKSAGPGVTLQDGGRRGYLRFGVTGAGPMDPFAFAAANLAVNNDRDATAIEVSSGGVNISCKHAAIDIAVVGGEFVIRRDGKTLPSASRLTLRPGELLEISSGSSGNWCYVAIGGRIDLPMTLGSHATHTRTGFGGIDGRAFQAGDEIPVAEARSFGFAEGRIIVPWPERLHGTIRVIAGPQRDYFADDQFATFVKQPWTVSMRGDRMAAFLDGPTLTHIKGYNIVSDGIARGAIQIPGEGHPIVLMADRQPTGGYPKIANVITADLGMLAQMRGGETFHFVEVSHEQAVEAIRENEAALSSLGSEPFTRTSFEKGFFDTLPLLGAYSENVQSSDGLAPANRIALLFDPGSVEHREVGTVVLAKGRVFGRSVMAYAPGSGTFDNTGSDAIIDLYDQASDADAIVVALLDSTAETTVEVSEAVSGVMRIIEAGAKRRLPEIVLASGQTIGPEAFLASAADFVFTVGNASILSAGPSLVERVIGLEVSEPDDFSAGHFANNVVAIAEIRRLIDLLPEGGQAPKDTWTPWPVKHSTRHAIQEKIRAIADHGEVIELQSSVSPGMLTYLARVGGVGCGILANDPAVNDGIMDLGTLRKAERFVRFCSRFSIPLLRLWDTPGVLPTSASFAAGRDLLLALEDHKAGGMTLDMTGRSRLVPALKFGPRRTMSQFVGLQQAALTALTGETF